MEDYERSIVFLLLWMILANVTDGWFAAACWMMATFYSVICLIELAIDFYEWRLRKKSR